MQAIKFIIAAVFLFMQSMGTIQAQDGNATEFIVQPETEVTILGSANVTDWDADVSTIEGSINIEKPENSDWSELQAGWFRSSRLTMPVADIKDHDSGSMTDNLQNYLKKDDHPQITFELERVTDVALADNSDNAFEVTAEGVINAAGVDHRVTLQAMVTVDGDKIRINGEHEMLMTDFGIDPPRAMLGTIRARDPITVEFNMVVAR